MTTKFFVRVKLPSGVWAVLSAKDKTQLCKQTASKHAKDMQARGFDTRIEEV